MSAADGSVWGRDADVALLFEHHRQSILSYCRRRLDSDEDAEDALQTTFVHALRSMRRGVRPHVEAAWLHAIARNVCRERWRSTQRRGAPARMRDVDELADVLAAPAHDDDELFDLDAALGRLARRQREALLLREWRGLSYEEIARRLELSESAVETLLFRARRSLAHELEHDTRGLRGALGLLLGMPRRFWQGGATAKLAAGTAAVSVAVVAGGAVPRLVGHDRAPARPAAVRATGFRVVAPPAVATPTVRRHVVLPAPRRVAPTATRPVRPAPAVTRSATAAPAPAPPALPSPPAAPAAQPAAPAPEPVAAAAVAAPPVPAEATLPPLQADVPPVTLQTPGVQLPAPLPSVPSVTLQTPAAQVTVPATSAQVTVPPLQSLAPPVQLPPVLP